jgi:hypothetical protein
LPGLSPLARLGINVGFFSRELILAGTFPRQMAWTNKRPGNDLNRVARVAPQSRRTRPENSLLRKLQLSFILVGRSAGSPDPPRVIPADLCGRAWTNKLRKWTILHRGMTLSRYAGKFMTSREQRIISPRVAYNSSDDCHTSAERLRHAGCSLINAYYVSRSWSRSKFYVLLFDCNLSLQLCTPAHIGQPLFQSAAFPTRFTISLPARFDQSNFRSISIAMGIP